ncbi:MAG: hypothetical protein IPI67_15170 [Myxococcales bacterium]|nr:hypothetical protein [Myxococcales bacterium]
MTRGCAAVLISFALLACEATNEPADPIWGKQPCGSCAMLVSDPAHAAQLVTSDGKRVFFDDPGCMAAYLQERGVTATKMWVRDTSGKWLDAKSARFSASGKTPMDYGFVVAGDGDADFSQLEAAARKRREQKP